MILMKFYDMNIKGQNFNNDLKLIKEASKFGWNYLNLNYSPEKYDSALEYKDDLIKELANFKNPIELDMGILINKSNSNEIRKIAKKYRNKTNYLSCLGGDLKVNRAICENIQFDVLSRPYFKRRDSGMNHVLAKEAEAHNVAIELCFNDITHNYLRYRANVIASFKEIIQFHRKFDFPLILTTDSRSIFDIRSTRDLSAFFKAVGLTDEEIANGFSNVPKDILEFNKERENMIVLGVKEIKRATDFNNEGDE